MAEPGAAYLSIGEVLSLLQEEFPDITISKIRFLESQGLIEPERTPSGYRKFYDEDVELLRVILREQREKFLPLRVIKDRIDSGEIERPDPTPARGARQPTEEHVAKHPSGRGLAGRGGAGSAGRAQHPSARRDQPRAAGERNESAPAHQRQPAASAPAEPAQQQAERVSNGNGAGARLLPGVLVNREELCAMASITPAQLAQLEEYGVLPKRTSGDLYGEDAVEIAAAAGGFLRAGIDARHLRAWRTSVEREAGLYEQLILPMLRQRNPQARSQAVAQLQELDALGTRLRAAMMRAQLRQYLD